MIRGGYKLQCETRCCAFSLSSPFHRTSWPSCSSSDTQRTVPLQTTQTWTPHSLQSWATPLWLTVQSATPLWLTVQSATPLRLTVQSATPLRLTVQSWLTPLRLTIYARSSSLKTWTPLTKPLPPRGPRCHSPPPSRAGGPVWCDVHQLSVGEFPTTPPQPRLAPPPMGVYEICFSDVIVHIPRAASPSQCMAQH